MNFIFPKTKKAVNIKKPCRSGKILGWALPTRFFQIENKKWKIVNPPAHADYFMSPFQGFGVDGVASNPERCPVPIYLAPLGRRKILFLFLYLLDLFRISCFEFRISSPCFIVKDIKDREIPLLNSFCPLSLKFRLIFPFALFLFTFFLTCSAYVRIV